MLTNTKNSRIIQVEIKIMCYFLSPGLLDAIFSDSLGVLKRTGSLGGLLPPMLMLWTWTMYSVSSSKSHSAQERVVVFTSWMNLSMRTSFFCRQEGCRESWGHEARCNMILHRSLQGNSLFFLAAPQRRSRTPRLNRYIRPPLIAWNLRLQWVSILNISSVSSVSRTNLWGKCLSIYKLLEIQNVKLQAQFHPASFRPGKSFLPAC